MSWLGSGNCCHVQLPCIASMTCKLFLIRCATTENYDRDQKWRYCGKEEKLRGESLVGIEDANSAAGGVRVDIFSECLHVPILHPILSVPCSGLGPKFLASLWLNVTVFSHIRCGPGPERHNHMNVHLFSPLSLPKFNTFFEKQTPQKNTFKKIKELFFSHLTLRKALWYTLLQQQKNCFSRCLEHTPTFHGF